MDQSLKQRLIGTIIAVALVVIFVPMLFEKSDDKGKLSTAGIPSIPDDVMEKTLELPKTAEDLAPKEEEENKAPVESGYRIVPFNEPVPPDTALKKPVEAKGEKPKQPNTEVKTPSAAPVAEGVAVPDPEDEVVPAQEPAPSPQAKPKPASKPSEPAAKKAEAAAKPPTAKPAEALRPVLKTVKVAKPKPPVPPPDIEEAEEPVPSAVPAKTAAPAAKPKSQAATPRRPADASAKKPEAAKPAETQRPAAKAEKPEPEPVAAHQQPVKAVAPKPAAAPAKPAQAAAKAPPPKKPSAWVVQAGSFTDEAAARSLADKLKQSKFPASVQAIKGEHGSVYRVQVGAAPDRGRAEETLKQIEGSTGINGIITERH